MVLKIIEATQAKPGAMILIENEPYIVKSNDISKSGKHGASKCRIQTSGVFNGKKKILAVPGSERFDVPNVDKRRAQVLSVGEGSASVMDLESYETIDVQINEDVNGEVAVEKQVELWDIEGIKMIMRVL
ncbi:translation initiation factor IF-5A [Candidatus Pacearchaeota archaeon]|nr:translation initiation factor IF-5A [Candidatus Pacearchaeota archaeon]